MKRTLILIFIILSCLLVGFIASKIQAEAIANWYPTLNKSSLTPPNQVFSVVWTLLYICMGASIGFIMGRNNPKEMLFLRLFSLQLLLNFAYSITFFYMQNPLLGFINIILLALVIFRYLIKTYYRANKFSFALFIPYFLWVLFAGYLNLYILINN